MRGRSSNVAVALRLAVGLILALCQGEAQSYSYDAAGRLTRVAYLQGGGALYRYDTADNLVAVVPLNLPAAPALTQVRRTGSTATIAWQGAPGAQGYRLERRLAGGGPWLRVADVGPDVTSFTDQGLLTGEDYVYRVSALGADGLGAYSEEISTADTSRPTISQGGVLNGASFDSGQGIAPGSIVSVFGENIGLQVSNGEAGPASATAEDVPLPVELIGYSVWIDGLQAPLFFVGGAADATGRVAGQINVQVPWEVSSRTSANFVVRRTGSEGQSESAVEVVEVAEASPAIFTFEFGPGPAAVINVKVSPDDSVVNGSLAQPEDFLPGVQAQPALRGGVVTVFANGLGPVDPPAQTGEASEDVIRRTLAVPRVFIGGTEAQVLFSGLTPQFVALYQINVIVPPEAPVGPDIPIRLEVDGQTSREDTTIAVR